jgi:predicted cupin superfamily sugar epimerase
MVPWATALSLGSAVVALNADDVKRLLSLAPHPTCGFTAQTYRSPHQVKAAALPDRLAGDHALGSALYFMVTPDAHIALHRIRSDQIYHHYLGAPLEVLLLFPDGGGALETVGPDLAAGMRPQLLIPGATWHVSRLPEGDYALLATTEWPGFEPVDLELGDPDVVAESYPDFADELRRLSSSHERMVPRGHG